MIRIQGYVKHFGKNKNSVFSVAVGSGSLSKKSVFVKKKDPGVIDRDLSHLLGSLDMVFKRFVLDAIIAVGSIYNLLVPHRYSEN